MDRLMLVDEIFKVDPFSMVNIVMIQKLGLAAAIVCNELEQRQNYWDDREVKDWYATYENIEEKTGLTNRQVNYAVKKLCDIGLVHSNNPVYIDEIKVKYYRFDFNAKDDFMKSKIDGSVSRNYTADKFIIYSKTLAQKIGPECTLILRDLCRTYIEAARRDNLIDGWFKCKRSSMAKKIGLNEKTMGKYLDKLVDHGIIDRRRSSNSIDVKINLDTLLDLFDFNTWEELSALIDERQKEKDKKRMTAAESITTELLKYIKKVSNKHWELSYKKIANIEDLIAAGYDERQLKAIVDYVYCNHKDEDEIFNWDVMFIEHTSYWMSSINRETAEEKKKAKIRVIVENICKKMREHSDGEVYWIVDDSKIKLIDKCINCDKHFTEDELIQFAIGRYDDNKAHGYKMTLFDKLYKEWDHIEQNRELHRRKKYSKKGSKKTNNTESRDGVKSNTYTKSEIEAFKAKAAKIEEEGGQGVF